MSKSIPRQPAAVAAKFRNSAGAMHDRRQPRGGSRNLQIDYLNDLSDDLDVRLAGFDRWYESRWDE